MFRTSIGVLFALLITCAMTLPACDKKEEAEEAPKRGMPETAIYKIVEVKWHEPCDTDRGETPSEYDGVYMAYYSESGSQSGYIRLCDLATCETRQEEAYMLEFWDENGAFPMAIMGNSEYGNSGSDVDCFRETVRGQLTKDGDKLVVDAEVTRGLYVAAGEPPQCTRTLADESEPEACYRKVHLVLAPKE